MKDVRNYLELTALPANLVNDFLEGCEIAHHAAILDYDSLLQLVNTKVTEWLQCETFLANLANDTSIKQALVFSWDFEDVGDRVATSCAVSLAGATLTDTSFTDNLQDIRIEQGIPAARKYAKAYAKRKGYSFTSDEADSYGYRSALMTCHNRNR